MVLGDVEMNMVPLYVNMSHSNQSTIATSVSNQYTINAQSYQLYSQYNETFATPNVNQCIVAPSVPNEPPLQYNETSAAPNVNQCNIDTSVSNEPPPQYTEASATPNDGVEAPPTYDEALTQENVTLIRNIEELLEEL